MDYHRKYIKYKTKYLERVNMMVGGGHHNYVSIEGLPAKYHHKQGNIEFGYEDDYDNIIRKIKEKLKITIKNEFITLVDQSGGVLSQNASKTETQEFLTKTHRISLRISNTYFFGLESRFPFSIADSERTKIKVSWTNAQGTQMNGIITIPRVKNNYDNSLIGLKEYIATILSVKPGSFGLKMNNGTDIKNIYNEDFDSIFTGEIIAKQLIVDIHANVNFSTFGFMPPIYNHREKGFLKYFTPENIYSFVESFLKELVSRFVGVLESIKSESVEDKSEESYLKKMQSIITPDLCGDIAQAVLLGETKDELDKGKSMDEYEKAQRAVESPPKDLYGMNNLEERNVVPFDFRDLIKIAENNYPNFIKDLVDSHVKFIYEGQIEKWVSSFLLNEQAINRLTTITINRINDMIIIINKESGLSTEPAPAHYYLYAGSGLIPILPGIYEKTFARDGILGITTK